MCEYGRHILSLLEKKYNLLSLRCVSQTFLKILEWRYSQLENITCASIYHFMELLYAGDRASPVNDANLGKDFCLEKVTFD